MYLSAYYIVLLIILWRIANSFSASMQWAVLCNAFLVEAKWFDSGEVPTAQVYLENGIVSSGTYVVAVHLFYLLGLGGISNKGAVNLNDILDELISSATTILRLWDDFGSAKVSKSEYNLLLIKFEISCNFHY